MLREYGQATSADTQTRFGISVSHLIRLETKCAVWLMGERVLVVRGLFDRVFGTIPPCIP